MAVFGGHAARRTVLLAIAFMLFAGSSLAAAPKPEKTAMPDPAANPVLAKLAQSGARMFFLGEYDGLDGWLIIKNNQMQIAYAPADGKSILIGALFGADGESVTAAQIKALMDGDASAKTALMNLQTASAGLPAGAPGILPDANSPGERLLKALAGSPGVTVGAQAAPVLFMVADPNCPHCRATWHMLRGDIFGNRLQVRLVPIGTLGSDSERAAAIFLHVPHPLDAWDKYVDGDAKQLAGLPDSASYAAVRANHALIDSWHIGITPYLVYRARDGQVKIVQGEPAEPEAMVADIAAPPPAPPSVPSSPAP